MKINGGTNTAEKNQPFTLRTVSLLESKKNILPTSPWNDSLRAISKARGRERERGEFLGRETREPRDKTRLAVSVDRKNRVLSVITRCWIRITLILPRYIKTRFLSLTNFFDLSLPATSDRKDTVMLKQWDPHNSKRRLVGFMRPLSHSAATSERDRFFLRDSDPQVDYVSKV